MADGDWVPTVWVVDSDAGGRITLSGWLSDGGYPCRVYPYVASVGNALIALDPEARPHLFVCALDVAEGGPKALGELLSEPGREMVAAPVIVYWRHEPAPAVSRELRRLPTVHLATEPLAREPFLASVGARARTLRIHRGLFQVSSALESSRPGIVAPLPPEGRAAPEVGPGRREGPAPTPMLGWKARPSTSPGSSAPPRADEDEDRGPGS